MRLKHPHKTFEGLEFEAKYFPAVPAEDYSEGYFDPGSDARWEIKEIYWRGQDVTELIDLVADHLYPEFQNDLEDAGLTDVYTEYD